MKYYTRVKEVVNAIHGANGEIKDETMISKVLRTLLPINSIRVFAIQEPRCILDGNLTLGDVVGRLSNFEMPNFDNYTPTTIECSFKSQLVLSKKKGKHVKSESDSFDDEISKLESLISKRFGRGRGKYKHNYLSFFFVKHS